MKKEKRYRYLGRNGIITSPILLEDIKAINMLLLIADEGKALWNGEEMATQVLIFEDEINDWSEIDDPKD